MGIFFFDAQGQLTPHSLVKSGQNSNSSGRGGGGIVVVLVTYKYEEDPIKNEGDRVLTRFFPL